MAISNNTIMNLVDIHNNIIKEGDIIIWNNFVWDEGNSSDWFGTESENNYHVVETYIEERLSIVTIANNNLCILYDSNVMNITEVIASNQRRLTEFAIMHNGYYLNNFLENISENKTLTVEEVKLLLKKIEICNVK